MAEFVAMRLRRGFIACAIIGSCLLPAPAIGELFVYEPFDYPVGEQLIDKNGGTGFTGAWRMGTAAVPQNAAVIQAGSLTYPGLPTMGNSVLMSGASGTNLEIFRNFNNIAGDDGTQTWISFIGQRLGPIQDPAVNANNPYPRGVNISFYNTEGFAAHGREQFAIGNASGAATNDWAFIGHGQVANIVPSTTPAVPYGGAPPALIVLRIDHHGPPNVDGPGNNDDIYFFINPDTSVEPNPANANAKRLGTEPNTFDYAGLDYFRPFVGNLNGANPYGELLWDELRIGSTYSDVVGQNAIPILPGDTDSDGVPGEFPDDFEPIRANFRKPVGMRSDGDLVGDGIVDFNDFRQWKTAFLAAGGSLANVDIGFLGNVPEPASCLLAAFACLALSSAGARRRRQ